MTYFPSVVGLAPRTLRFACLWLLSVGLGFVSNASAAPPSNDNFSGRTPLQGSPVVSSASNVEATRESFEPTSATHTLWWSWTAPSSGIARINVSGVTADGQSFPSELAIFNGGSIDTLKLIGIDTGNQIAFPTVAGAVYQISVGNTDSLGTVTLSIALGATTVTAPVVVGTPAAANDNFDDRTVLSGAVVSGIGYNHDATHESFERDSSTHTLWWTWTAPANAMVAITTAGTITTGGNAFPVELSVFNGASLDALTYVADDEDQPASVTFPTVAGAVYQISTGNTSSLGSVVVNVTTSPLQITSPQVIESPAAANDNYANAQSLGNFASVSGFGFNTDASVESLESANDRTHTLWWTWTAPQAGTLTLSTTGSSMLPTVNAYVGADLASAVNVGNIFSLVSTGVFSAPVEAGTTYHFVMGSDSTGTDVLTLNFAQSSPVATLVAPIPTTKAESGTIAEFAIDLSGPVANDTFVNYSIKGTAINGTDYVLLSGTKKIKAGKSSKPIKVIPLGNLGGASKKTVKLTLEPGTGYTVGTTMPVKVKILAP